MARSRNRHSPSAFPGPRWMHGIHRSWSLFCRAATSLSWSVEIAICHETHLACSHIDPREFCVLVSARTRFAFSSGHGAPVCRFGLRLEFVCRCLISALHWGPRNQPGSSQNAWPCRLEEKGLHLEQGQRSEYAGRVM